MSEHDHEHTPIERPDTAPGEYELLALAVKELLIEKSLFSADDLRAAIEKMDARSPAAGARIVARAWLDPAFRKRLLRDGGAAAAELGIDVSGTRLVVVENTDTVHNLIVCTLCSCYPRAVLGLPPDWYKSTRYRSRAVCEPRDVLSEFGTEIAPEIAVRVHDSTADMRYLVLPKRPPGTETMDEAALATLVTRDAMIGVSEVRAPCADGAV